jgi:DNA-binding NtrC family response regulator
MRKPILVVDDDVEIRDCFGVALSVRDYPVKLSPDRENAIFILKRDADISIIILDYNMPGMSCENFVKMAREIRPNVKIMLVSASTGLKSKARNMGIEKFLGKPVDFNDLYEAIDEVSKTSSDNQPR